MRASSYYHQDNIAKRVSKVPRNAFLNKKKRKEGSPKKIISKRYIQVLQKVSSLAIILGSLYGIYFAIFKSDYFKVRYIDITGTSTYVNADDLKNIVWQNSINSQILLLNTKKLHESVKNYFLGAKNIYISKKLPNKIIVNVEERKPIAILTKLSNEEKYLIDEEGYVLGTVNQENTQFPSISYDGDIFVGSFIDKKIIPVSQELLNGASEMDLKVSSLSFKPTYATVYINSTQVHLSLNTSIKESLKVVSSLFKTLGLEGKSIKKIDLRYDKVVVLYD